MVVVVVANPKGKIRKKGERERRKKVSSLSPFASPQFSSFLQFKIFLTLAGSVEARADKGWAVKRAPRSSFNRDFKIWDATTSRTRWLIKDWTCRTPSFAREK